MRTRCALHVSTLLIFVAATATTTTARAEDYEIKLVRPVKVGQKYTIAADAALLRKTKMTIGAGQKPNETEDGYGVRLEGTVEVLAVNADGEEGKTACTVAKCVRVTPEGEQELVPAGRVVTATGGKQDTTFAIDQGKLSPEATEALELVLRMGEEDGYNDDRVYGTDKRQPVGGSWPLNSKAASDEAKSDGVIFEPADITGSLTLEAVEDVAGVKCMRIAGVTEIKRFKTDAPEKMTFENGSAKAKYSGLYPLDANMGTLAESNSMTHVASYRGKGAGGEDIVVEYAVQRAVEMKRTFVAK